MPAPRSIVLPVLAAFVVAVVAYSAATHGGGPAAQSKTVVAPGRNVHLMIADYAYQPAALRVRVGATITVTNTDSTAHTVSAQSGVFDSGTLAMGKSAHFTLNKPGTYSFYCQFHAFMRGTIVVVK